MVHDEAWAWDFFSKCRQIKQLWKIYLMTRVLPRLNLYTLSLLLLTVFSFLFKCSDDQQRESQGKHSKMSQPKEEVVAIDEGDEDEHGDALCGACGENYANDEFWICCDTCEKWFHGKCVKITPARAEHIKQYKCPSCSNKRGRTG